MLSSAADTKAIDRLTSALAKNREGEKAIGDIFFFSFPFLQSPPASFLACGLLAKSLYRRRFFLPVKRRRKEPFPVAFLRNGKACVSASASFFAPKKPAYQDFESEIYWKSETQKLPFSRSFWQTLWNFFQRISKMVNYSAQSGAFKLQTDEF